MGRTLSDLAKSSAVSGAVAILLAYQGLLPESKRTGWLIWTALVVGVLDAVVGYVLVRRAREQARREGLVRDQLGDLTMHLAELATDRPQDWAAELLLARRKITQTIGRLRRATFHRLGSGTPIPAALGEDAHAPAAECLRTGMDVLWSTATFPNGASNFGDSCDPAYAERLRGSAGACRCTVVTDRNEARILGVLVVYYVAPTPDLIVGTMEQQRFADIQRRAAKALGRALLDE